MVQGWAMQRRGVAGGLLPGRVQACAGCWVLEQHSGELASSALLSSARGTDSKPTVNTAL